MTPESNNEWWVKHGRDADGDDLGRWVLDPDSIDGLLEEQQTRDWEEFREMLPKEEHGACNEGDMYAENALNEYRRITLEKIDSKLSSFKSGKE